MASIASLTAVMLLAAAASATQQQTSSSSSQPGAVERQVCHHVVSVERGAKPYELCMTKGQWEAKERADAKDPNRPVCRYMEASNTRFKSYKVCMSAAEWENQRQRERQAIERIQSGVCVPMAGC